MAKDFMVKESELDDIQMRVLNSVLDKNIVVSGCAAVVSLCWPCRRRNVYKARMQAVARLLFLQGLCVITWSQGVNN